MSTAATAVSSIQTQPVLVFGADQPALPQELCFQIFSNLGPQGLEAARLVSRDMSNCVIEAAKVNEPVLIQNFIQALMQKVAQVASPEQMNQLKTLHDQVAQITANQTAEQEANAEAQTIQTTMLQTVSNLKQLKEYILTVQTQLIGIIKTFDGQMLQSLVGQLYFPKFMKEQDILMAKDEGEIRALIAAVLSNALPEGASETQRNEALVQIFDSMSRDGICRMAFKIIIPMISDDHRIRARYAMYRSITENLLPMVAHFSEADKGQLLRECALGLADIGAIDRAKTVALMITANEALRNNTLAGIDVIAEENPISHDYEAIRATLAAERMRRAREE